jgi:hypothetical protein
LVFSQASIWLRAKEVRVSALVPLHRKGYETSIGVANRQITLTPPIGLWKPLRLVVRDVSENSAVPFPNSLDPPIVGYGRFVREVYVSSESRADPQSLGCQPCSGGGTKIPTPYPGPGRTEVGTQCSSLSCEQLPFDEELNCNG